MSEPKDLSAFIKHSPLTKSIKSSLWAKLAPVLLGGLAAVTFMPLIDKAMTGGDSPGIISFVGTGLIISLLTYYLFVTSLGEAFEGNQKILGYALFYNILIILVKFTLAPAFVYQSDPTLVVDNGGLFSIGDLANFNGSPLGIALLVAGVFLCYYAMFSLLKYIAVRGVKKRFHLKSLALRKRVSVAGILIVIAACVFTGGAIILIPLILSLMFLSNSVTYLGFVFSTGYSILIAASLAAAVAFAGAMFIETERETVMKRNLHLLITVIWAGIGLLLIFHVLWAVYLFMLTTLWPFKVVTVTSK